MALTHEELFGSNKTKPCVRGVFGVSGSGKTIFLNEMLKKASRSKSYGPMWRAVVFDVKHEGYENLLPEKIKPCRTMDDVVRSMKKSRITVVHPQIESAEPFLDEVISYIFELSQRVEDFSATLVLEESSTFIGANAGSIPPAIKRMATQGRSLGLSLILANQRALSNKWTDTQSTSLTLFRLARPDSEMLKKRWGLDADAIEGRLSEKQFSFAHYDLEKLTLDYYSPVEMTPKLSAKAEIKPSKAKNPIGGSLGPF